MSKLFKRTKILATVGPSVFAEEKLKEYVKNKSHEMYGENLPEIVSKRIDKELNSIINNKFSVIY